jgi:Tfp pilus assembly protein PilV
MKLISLSAGMLKNGKTNRNGFSLAEILISLLVLSGALTTMFSGFDVSQKLDSQAKFESEAAYLGERDMELLKTDFLSKKRMPVAGFANSRFRLKPGWEVKLKWTVKDKFQTLRIQTEVTNKDNKLLLESFLYLPDGENS